MELHFFFIKRSILLLNKSKNKDHQRPSSLQNNVSTKQQETSNKKIELYSLILTLQSFNFNSTLLVPQLRD